jgi:hypothetical protein
VCRMLLEKGATHTADENGETPLFVLDYAAVCEILLDYGATHAPNVMAAAQNGHARTCKLLLRRGASRSVKNETGETALELARKNGHAASCKVIIGHKDEDRDVVELRPSGVDPPNQRKRRQPAPRAKRMRIHVGPAVDEL